MTKNFLVDLFNQPSTMQVPAFTNFSPAHVLRQNVACGYIHRCCSTCVSLLCHHVKIISRPIPSL